MPDPFTQQNDPTPYINSIPGLVKPSPAPAEPPPDTKPEDYTKKRLELANDSKKVGDEEIAHLTALQEKYENLVSRHTPLPHDPQLTSAPKPPKFDYTDPIKAFQNPAVLIATLGSLFSRAPMTAALNAGAAAMTAYHKGEAEVFTQKREEWKEALDAAMRNNQIELDKYNVAWKKSDAAVKDKMAELAAVAAGQKNETVIAAIRTGQIDKIDGIYEGLQKAQDKLKEIQARTKSVDLANAESTATLIGEYKLPPLTGWAARSEYGQTVNKLIQERYPDYNAQDYYAGLARKRVEATAEPMANRAALTALTKQKAAIDSYESLAKKNGAVLVQLAEKVDNTGLPVIERWLRAGQQATGDPDVAKFNAQIQIYRAEVARILSNPSLTGVLTDHARTEAEGFLQGGASSGQIRAVVELFNQDFERRSQSINEELDSLRGKKPQSAPSNDGWTITPVQ